jgi:vacuole morphology and inheritance protein 14
MSLKLLIDDEIQQSTALRWLAEFLNFTHEVMVPFTPRLVPAILPNLAHHVAMIQSAAIRTNKLLFNVIQNLPSPAETPPKLEKPPSSRKLRSPTPSATNSRPSTLGKDISRDVSSPELVLESPTAPTIPLQRSRASTADISMTPRAMPPPEFNLPPPPNSEPSRPHSPVSFTTQAGQAANASSTQQPPPTPEDTDLFDYQATVNELTIQFLSEFEETRVAALKWLIMLHQKAPKKVGPRLTGSRNKTHSHGQ